MWSDPVADMLTRIRNAVRVHAREVKIPASNLKLGIAKVLQEEGYILSYDRIADTKQGLLRIQLKYNQQGEAVIREIERFENAPFAPAADRPAPQRPEPGRAPEGALARLTRRQRQVLDLIAQGRSNKQIARDLGITEGTAKLHVFSLMRALDVTNRTMLALAAHALHPRTDR